MSNRQLAIGEKIVVPCFLPEPCACMHVIHRFRRTALALQLASNCYLHPSMPLSAPSERITTEVGIAVHSHIAWTWALAATLAGRNHGGRWMPFVEGSVVGHCLLIAHKGWQSRMPQAPLRSPAYKAVQRTAWHLRY